MNHKFPAKVSRATKRGRGRTAVEATPIAIRSSTPIDDDVQARMRKKLARRIGHAAAQVERGTIRFEDINGPRGGVDTECRIKLVLSGRPSVQASDRGRDVEPAFDRASYKVQHALARARGRHQRKPMKLKTARRPPSRKAVKTKARRAKHRVGVQRGRRR